MRERWKHKIVREAQDCEGKIEATDREGKIEAKDCEVLVYVDRGLCLTERRSRKYISIFGAAADLAAHGVARVEGKSHNTTTMPHDSRAVRRACRMTPAVAQ